MKTFAMIAALVAALAAPALANPIDHVNPIDQMAAMFRATTGH